jgi:hypothetical protein
MTKPFKQFTDKNLKHALTHYKSTGKILDVLLVCFDQHGKWYGHHGLLLDEECSVSPVTSKCTTCGHFKVHHFGWVFSDGLRGRLARI